MIYKTLEDLNRVIALGKPQAVVNKFAESYLAGVAVAPYLAAENEYSALQVQEDQPDVEAVLDPESGEVITGGYSPNQLRDDRLAELEEQFPHLVEPDPEAAGGYVPSVIERRPPLELNYNLVAPQLRTFAKLKRAQAMESLTVTTTGGKVFDADETSQGRMARAILAAEAAGLSETQWGMADNTVQVVSLAEMKEALGKAMVAQGELWFI